jgi:hypothetical protein
MVFEFGSIPEQKNLNGFTFPLVVEPPSTGVSSLAWVQDQAPYLKRLLAEHGAILFRGFEWESAKDFYTVVSESLGVQALPYVGGAAPRHAVYKDVHTTNESPPDQPIPFHHEMAQVPRYPSQVLFFCLNPPIVGGETPIVQSDVVYSKVQAAFPDFVRDLESKGVVYTRTIPKDDDPSSPIGRGWVNTFQTQDPSAAEEAAKALNVTLKWLPNGDVKTISARLDAIKEYTPLPDSATTPQAKKKVWFNSLVAAYVGWRDSRNDPSRAVTFGDGSLMDETVIQGVVQLMDEAKVAVPWQKGDLMWIDNNQVMHSRWVYYNFLFNQI